MKIQPTLFTFFFKYFGGTAASQLQGFTNLCLAVSFFQSFLLFFEKSVRALRKNSKKKFL